MSSGRARRLNSRWWEEVDAEQSVFIECRGVAHCERENRSVSCRTFPYEPYFDNEENLLGLIYNRVLENKCYLVDRHRVVTKKFVDEFLRFFNRLFELLPAERELYMAQSRLYRQKMSRRKKPLVVVDARRSLRGGLPGRKAHRSLEETRPARERLSTGG